MRKVRVHRLLAGCADQRGVKFMIGDDQASAFQVLAPEVMLPIVALAAQARAAKDLHLDIGVRLYRSPEATLYYRAEVPDMDVDGNGVGVLRAAYLLHAMESVFGIPPVDAHLDGTVGDVFNGSPVGKVIVVDCVEITKKFMSQVATPLPPESRGGYQWLDH